MQVYLDNAATTPLTKEVMDAMTEAMLNFGNPSSLHAAGRKSKSTLEAVRRNIAKYLNCTPAEIFFTSGGTEGDNLAILGTVSANSIQTIITSKIEHSAIIDSVAQASQMYDVDVKWVNLLESGDIDLNHLKELLEQNPKSLVSLMHVNNEIGNVLKIQEVAEMCKVHGAIFHSDTVQSMGHIPIDLNAVPVDIITGSAHKIHGPKGAGFLFVRKGLKMNALVHGGKQERELRGGTENIVGIAGLGKAMSEMFENFEDANGQILKMKSHFIHAVTQQIPGIQFNGHSGDINNSVNTVVSIYLPDHSKNDMMLFQLDLKGVMVSGGSACSSGSLKGSRVLTALNQNAPSLRFSFSKETTTEEVDYAVKQLVDILGE